VADACIFCGGTPTTVEHVLSRKWLAELMPGQRSFTTHMTRSEESGEQVKRTFRSKSGKGGGGSHPVNCACAPCNNGWMQDLDNELRPALTAFVRGDRGTLEIAGCRVFATWATKIALLIDEMWNPPVLDRDFKRSFGANPAPPERWTFFTAVRTHSDDRSHLRAITLGPSPSSDHIEAVVFTFRVLHLAVQVLAPIEPVVLRHNLVSRPYVQQVWPRLTPLRWPPPQHARIGSDKALERLEESVQAQRVRPPE
jgi:hypothetical protein